MSHDDGDRDDENPLCVVHGLGFEGGVTIVLVDPLGVTEMRPRLWWVRPGEKLSYQATAERRAGSGVVHATTTPTTATTLAPRNAAW